MRDEVDVPKEKDPWGGQTENHRNYYLCGTMRQAIEFFYSR